MPKPLNRSTRAAATPLLIGAVLLGFGGFALASTTREGAFTAEQAERGRQVYDRSCQTCHQADFYQERLRLWQNRSIGELFEIVSTTMPADNVGELRTSEYLDVLAYVLSITGAPSGEEELTTDTMDAVTITPPTSD